MSKGAFLKGGRRVQQFKQDLTGFYAHQ